HPDGTIRFVKTALEVFSAHFSAHALGTDCGLPVTGVLPVSKEAPPEVKALPSASSPKALPGRETEPAEKLLVDWTLCQGHGLCADAAPGVIRLGEDGYPQRAVSAVPPELRAEALRAVRRCPALALRLQS
ncbi:ferredoxin, partial [Streptomyces durbertensis]